MKIATFGCSFTQGVGPNFYSYAKELANLNSSYTVDDFSKGGSSIKWSIDQFITNHRKYDYTIFQVTTPCRFTFANNTINYKKIREKHGRNFTKYKPELHQHLVIYNSHFKAVRPNLYYTQKEKETLHKVLYSSLNEDLEKIEWQNYINFVSHHTDLVLFHDIYWMQESQISNQHNFMSMEEIIGKNQFNNHIIDKGNHIDQDGCIKVAEWINNKIQSGK